MMFPIYRSDDARSRRLIERRVTRDPQLIEQVSAIVDAVRRGGDVALRRYARRFDGYRGPLELDRDAIAREASTVPPAVRRAVAACARNIRRVARAQRPRSVRVAVAPGVTIEQRILPLARVGCYVPGGRYPLPSSLLMTAIPAKVAGVGEVIAVCPKPDPVVAAAALEASVDRLFVLGGAQAIAALAYGTGSVPRVDKIVGPGNRFVAAAKRLVSADCGIDFEAGPSELVWLTDQTRPDWVAWDLLAQAEHDPDARALLVTTSQALAQAVRECIADVLESAGDTPAREALRRNGGAIVATSWDEARALVDRIAPEHLATDDAVTIKGAPRAGTVFAGPFSVPAAGDYATGSNHVLPTAGAARFRGGLSAADFVRIVSIQTLSSAGARRVATAASTMAGVEGLRAHKASVEARRS
jgi:histidinol dehydrogenase